MSIWSLWFWICGYVRFEAEGALCERFLEAAFARGIDIRRVRHQHGVVTAQCPSAQYRLLRPFARRTGTRVRLLEKRGFPFWIRRYRTHGGLAAGLACAFLLLAFLSGRIWVIDVRATQNGESVTLSEAEQQTICKAMQKMGVDYGRPTAALSMRDIRMQGIAMLPSVNWLSVNLVGSVAHIDAELVKPVAPLEPTAPSNLVAKTDGRILSMQIKSGQSMVQIGDGIAAGTLLVSGATDTAAGTLFHRSFGEVIAETRHTLSVSVPLSETQLCPTGRVYHSATLTLFGLSVPLSTRLNTGRLADISYTDTVSHPLIWRGTVLPVGITNERLVPLAQVPVSYTPDQALALAYARLAEREASHLSGATVLSRSVLETRSADGVTLTADYLCTENIAREVPLLIGE